MASEELILHMLRGPPDRNEPLPISNRKETIYGSTVPFLVLSWAAVSTRLWVRFRIMREPGWDDLFVVLSAISNTIATAFVLRSIEYGLGQHFLYIGLGDARKYLLCFYVENGIYVTQTALIKISLLFQYLRIFKGGAMRWVCLGLLNLVVLWGLAYGFIAWVPCFPVHGYWNRASETARCYGFGFSDPGSFIATFESHTALNMAFDITIFLTPMVLFRKPNLRWKNVLAMVGVFTLGSVVVFTSIWRLYTIVDNRAGTYPYIDFTWWPPISIILSCLEIDLAIMCASIPIFWPVIEKSLSQIFVTHEVCITEHHRMDANDFAYQLGYTDLERKASIKSESAYSRASLTREFSGKSSSRSGRLAGALENHYKDQYVLARVDPLAGENVHGTEVAIKTSIETESKPKWRI